MSRRTFHFDQRGVRETFDEPDDWVAFARDALFDKASYPFFDLDLRDGYGGPDKRLFDLYDALKGTGAEDKLADGVLRVMETGTPEERFKARLGPYQWAPNVIERIARMITADRAAIVEADLFDLLIDRLFQIENARELALELLHAELLRPDASDLGSVATERDFDWFADHLPPYRASFDPRFWMRFLDEKQADRLLDAMVRVGGYEARLRAELTNPKLGHEQRNVLRQQLLSHPIVKRWVE